MHGDLTGACHTKTTLEGLPVREVIMFESLKTERVLSLFMNDFSYSLKFFVYL